MPKVNDGYYLEKRKEILRAAFEVCKRKPAWDVTMSDIVAETGMSQGGVYKYFGNICAVYAALIDEANLKGGQTERIDGIMASGDRPEIKLRKLFEAAEEYFSEMLIRYNKILFELSTYSLQNPEAGERINELTTVKPVFPYLARRVSELIMTGAREGYFRPVVPAEDIPAFVIASFDGIIRDVTLNKCYGKTSDEMTGLNEKKLIGCLYSSTLKLLGM